MILKRYINQEVFRTSAAILIILILILISNSFVRNILPLAVDGSISSSAVFSLLGLQVPAVAGFLLPLSFFIGIMLTFGRLYSESEMSAIKSVGVGEAQLAKNLFPLAIVLALIAGILTFWVTPWAGYQSKSIMLKEESEARFGAFSPGKFQEYKDKSGVAFVNSKKENGDIQEIFAISGMNNEQQEMIIQVAKSGYLLRDKVKDNTDVASKLDYMVLEEGATYSFNKEKKSWEISEYGTYSMLFKEPKLKEVNLKNKAIPTLELLKNYDANAASEIHWRLSAPLSTLLLCLLAVPLAQTQPRKGKFSRLLPAMAIYIIYALLLMDSRQLVASGKIPYVLGFWWIHLPVLLFAIYLYRPRLLSKPKHSVSDHKVSD